MQEEGQCAPGPRGLQGKGVETQPSLAIPSGPPLLPARAAALPVLPAPGLKHL